MNHENQATTGDSHVFTCNNLDPIRQAPQVDYAPSISGSALLAELSIGVWEGRKKDKEASRTITTINKANKKSARVTKDLLGNCDELKAIKSCAASIRDFHRNCTLPWSNLGHRLLTNEQFLDYNREMEDRIVNFWQLVDDFLGAYSLAVSVAEVQLGTLYKAWEYPSVDILRSKFRIHVNYMPVPERGDFRLDIPAEAKKVLEQSYNKFYDEQLTSALTDVWQRVLEPLQHMSKMLDYNEGEKSTGFRDTLVEHVKSVAGVLKACNINKDPKMERVRIDLVNALSGVTPDGLRQNPHLRAQTKRNVDEIIKGLPSLGW
tara:strand:+ start:37 stop:993 length:957 start_codon:yes stop_codon:yes gene_type:complete